MAMNLIDSTFWASSESLGPIVSQWITIAICATDNDYDCANSFDRSSNCDTFTIPLYNLHLDGIPVMTGVWNPQDADQEQLCLSERYISPVAFINPDTILLNADSIVLAIGNAITILPFADSTVSPGETLSIPLELLSEIEGHFSDTLFIFDNRIAYPIGADTIYAYLLGCEFLAGPNPITPNGDGFYDEFLISMPRAGDIEINFFRLEGIRVKTIRGTERHYSWNGTDDNNIPQPPGIYLWVVRFNGEVFKHGSVTIAR
jgi:hypothetical protein